MLTLKSTNFYGIKSIQYQSGLVWNKLQKETNHEQIMYVYVYVYIWYVCICTCTCKFRYSFIQPIHNQCSYYIPLRTARTKSLVFWDSQGVCGGTICKKWVNHWQGSWDVRISLDNVFEQCKQICRFPADLVGFS